MDKSARIAAYFEAEGPFREGLALLREQVLKSVLEEDFKWSAPVYTLGGANVLGLMAFKKHFGIWFFNGVFLTDPLGVLENAQEGKTRAMRHWKFTEISQVNLQAVASYISEAIAIAEKGIKLPPKPKTGVFTAPELEAELAKEVALRARFEALPPYKQKEYMEYIATAKQEATKARRLAKILPMIRAGAGLNDAYR